MTVPAELVAFDLETTGLSAKADRIIEIGAVRFSIEGGVSAELQLLVDPGMPVPLAIQRLTGIAESELEGQPAPEEAVAQLVDFCEGAELVGHGAQFDVAFVAAVLPSFAHRPVLDTLELARILLPTAGGHGLPGLGVALGLPHDRPHRADSDALATAHLLGRLVATARAIRPATAERMRRIATQSDGALQRFFGELVDREPHPSFAVVPDPGAARPAAAVSLAMATERAAALASHGARPAELPADLEEATVALLGPDGRLAGAPGYEHRPEQVEMARAVAQTLDRGGRLLVEAGTGVGKSLAYLTPVALWTQRTGRRAVIATHTINLQEQLVGNDVAALQPLLPRPARVAILKGRQHYISLRRFERFLARPDGGAHGADLDSIRFKLKLLAWLEVTAAGDRGELRLPSTERALWRHVESDSWDCLGSACANWANARCHMVAARRSAAGAEVVVANHALLLAGETGEGQVLGGYDALVIDEAHNLEDSATRQSGHQVTGAEIAAVLQRLPEIADPALARALAAARDAASRLFGDVKGLTAARLGGGGSANGTIELTDAVREDHEFEVVERAAHQCVEALDAAVTALVEAPPETALAASELPQPERAEEELRLAAAALQRLAGAVRDVLLRPRPGHVAWMELRAEHSELHDAPAEVGGVLGQGLLDTAQATVLTSATLAVAGSFEFIRDRLGLRSRTEELLLPSPYDYLTQALALTISDIPPYDDPGYDAVLAKVVGEIGERLEGRTLALFTGYGALRRARDLLHDRLERRGIAVLAQGLDGTRRQLLASFMASPRTVLLGTSSFWEGIDLPGDALRCVVIAKLPFAVPTDPLVRARCAGLEDPFGRYVLPQAIIRLRQGFGRLIRSHGDRGAVVIADQRVTTREYGARFLAALPPAAVSPEPAAAVAARVAAFVNAAPAMA